MRQAGAEILRIKSGGVEADYKADASPVTQADHASEAILKAALAQFFPDIPVISEENTESHLLSPAARYFLVDPLDGTREFIRRDSNGHFTVNIGFIHQGM
ncbi:MAG: 3'(2'),5'-bisphosphate nucleotidase CysQ, partial [Proteobacteria bacterium]|nr:3'(2'),5'-bisphosphate nucleotidase CysQ [Pseudomonadota bacterium]